ncbi:hypothetical protein [Amycolatopsis dendrobii]|uniref:Uncharacterized protein n=1 Tax=Amycolatopsis dendrobii TaxID=2760662 RepID=A0A7W3ZF61_9PSEU|nr:hypothetical protein [Amycolatopsis dendrobii]MBB1159281.1 hypothetical protein [Amycolatopsis dendrobii]
MRHNGARRLLPTALLPPFASASRVASFPREIDAAFDGFDEAATVSRDLPKPRASEAVPRVASEAADAGDADDSALAVRSRRHAGRIRVSDSFSGRIRRTGARVAAISS